MSRMSFAARVGLAAGVVTLGACALAPPEYAHLRDGALPTSRVMVTGSRIPQRVTSDARNPSASSNVRVVTSEDLQNAQGMSIGEKISSIPGVW